MLSRAIHQVALDGGSWHHAQWLLPHRDPSMKREFAASEKELEGTAVFQEAMTKLKNYYKASYNFVI